LPHCGIEKMMITDSYNGELLSSDTSRSFDAYIPAAVRSKTLRFQQRFRLRGVQS